MRSKARLTKKNAYGGSPGASVLSAPSQPTPREMEPAAATKTANETKTGVGGVTRMAMHGRATVTVVVVEVVGTGGQVAASVIETAVGGLLESMAGAEMATVTAGETGTAAATIVRYAAEAAETTTATGGRIAAAGAAAAAADVQGMQVTGTAGGESATGGMIVVGGKAVMVETAAVSVHGVRGRLGAGIGVGVEVLREGDLARRVDGKMPLPHGEFFFLLSFSVLGVVVGSGNGSIAVDDNRVAMVVGCRCLLAALCACCGSGNTGSAMLRYGGLVFDVEVVRL